jgi:hypothetical protein
MISSALEKLERYRGIVRRLTHEYASYKPSHGHIETEAIVDSDRDHYEVMHVGWDGIRRVHGSVIHVDIIRGKVWIQYDGTSHPVAGGSRHSTRRHRSGVSSGGIAQTHRVCERVICGARIMSEKDDAIAAIQKLPDDASLDEMPEHLKNIAKNRRMRERVDLGLPVWSIDLPAVFLEIFRWAWFEEFPVTRTSTRGTSFDPNWAETSTWTRHAAATFKKCANRLGLYARFELPYQDSGGRMDGALFRWDGVLVACAEWEWLDTYDKELRDLKGRCQFPPPDFAFLVIYPGEDDHSAMLNNVVLSWTPTVPLVLFAVTHNGGKWREFREICTHIVSNKRMRHVGTRIPAFPWKIEGSHWSQRHFPKEN